MMTLKDRVKTKKEMIQELEHLRNQVLELRKSEREFKEKIDELSGKVFKYRTIADGTYDWEFWLSPAAEFLYSSPSCERITGYSAPEFENDPALFLRIIHPEDRSRVAENLNRKRAETSYCEIEFRVIHRDGVQRQISLVFHPVYGEDNQFMGIRGSNREITEAKQ